LSQLCHAGGRCQSEIQILGDFFEVAVHGETEHAACGDLQRPAGVESLHDVAAARAQAEHGLVHHVERELHAYSRFAVGQRRAEGVIHFVTRLRLFDVGFQVQVQSYRLQFYIKW
jgi:hypothetical protein